MKLLSVIALVIFCFLLTSCNGYKADYDKMVAENAALTQKLNGLSEEDKLVRGEYSSAIETLNAIEDTLRGIAEREKEIQKLSQSKEFSGNISQRQNILDKLDALKQANEKANSTAKAAQSQMKGLKIENEQLRKMIASAEGKIVEKEQQIQEQTAIITDMRTALNQMEGQLLQTTGELNTTYAELKAERDNLSASNAKLQSTIAELQGKNAFIDEQAQAFIMCGTKGQLRKANIIKDLIYQLTTDYKKNAMSKGTKVSFFENSEFECGSVGGNIADVLPRRDPSCYQIQGSKLIIKNAKMFWAVDKVVVLVKEKE
jgi:chromosome segregation ATPase